MTIKVIEQSTAERNLETEQLFQKCKPYLNEGKGLAEAVQKVKKTKHRYFYHFKWYKDLRNYAKTQGYTGLR